LGMRAIGHSDNHDEQPLTTYYVEKLFAD
jgi:hypothetical protein